MAREILEKLVYIGTDDNGAYDIRSYQHPDIDQRTLTDTAAVIIDLRAFGREAIQILIKKINTDHPSVPIIFTGCSPDKVSLFQALQSCILDFVMLPQDIDYLSQNIVRVIGLERGEQVTSASESLLNTGRLAQKFRIESRVSKAKEYIAQYYSRKIPLRELAGVCNLSPSTLSRKFKKENGETITHFIIRYRLQIARGLLLDGAMTIKQIAFATGFEDVAYFTKTFRERQGQTPSTYRN